MPLHTDRRNRSNNSAQPLTRWVPRQLEQLEDRLTPSAVLSNTPSWIDVGPNNISGGQSTNVSGAVNSSASITTATRAAGVATITTTAPVGLTVGGSVTITGVNVNEFNGTYRVTSVAGNTFSYNLILTPGSNGTGGTATASNSSVIGAVQAITPDLTDVTGNTLYAGGVNGGVWKTTNGLSATPNWVPLTDNYPSLSVSTISINPDNNQQILVGIGGTSDGVYTINASTGARIPLDSRGGARGDLAGALLSNDGGLTWSILSDKIGGQNVIGVAARGTTLANSYLLVATDGGLYRSTATTNLANLGKTFTQVAGGLPAGGIFDLAADPGAPVSAVSAASWNGSVATITTVNPHSLSVGQRVIVAAVGSTGGSTVGFNGTFIVTAVTANTFTYSLITDPGTYVSGGTANSDPTLDPLARNRFYIAVKTGTGPNTVGASSTASIFRSDNGGLTWGNVTTSTMSIGAKTTNIQIAVYNSGIITNNIVYVAVQNNNPTGAEANTTGFNYGWVNRGAAVSTISWSPNQGATWTRMDVPRTITNAQSNTRQDMFSFDAAGVVTVNTVVRHHLRTGDLVDIEGVTDNGDPAATNPVRPPLPINAINGFRTVTVTSETSFTLDGVNFTGQPFGFLRTIRTDLNSPFVTPMGTWAQVLGASGGERPEFFDLVADRVSSNIVYLGTDRAAASAGSGTQFYPNGSAGPTTFTANIWKGDRLVNPSGFGNSTTNSAQWTTLVNSGTGNGSAPAADVRDLAMGSNGQLIAATGGGLFLLPSPNPVTSNVANATWAANVATITTLLPHNFTVGQTVTISNIASAVLTPAGTPNGYNGSVVITGTTANSFTYFLAGDPGQFISSDSVAVNVATVQMAVPHGYTVGQNVTIVGVVPAGYNGTFTITGTPGATAISAPDAISNATWAAGVATITTTGLNGVQVNQQVTIGGVSVPGYNGTFTVTSVNALFNQFTYALPTYPGATTGGTQRNAPDAIASASWAANTATITTTAAHNMISGQVVTIAGVAVTGYNTTATITVTSATTFTYTLAVNPGNSAGAGGTAQTAAINITAATWSTAAGGTATITTASAPGVIVGDTVAIAGVPIAGYNGTFVVTAVTGNNISYTLANDPANATGGTETPVNGANDVVDATWASNAATITTQIAHNFAVGERVVLAGILSTGPGSYNGTFTITSVTANTFTYALANDAGVATRTRPTAFTHTLNAILPATTTSNNASVNGAVAGGTNWNTINGNLSVTNVASVAYDTQNNTVFAGTIDTGAIVQNSTGGNSYSTVFSATNTRDSFFDQASVFRVISDNSLLGNNGIPDALTKRYYVGTNFSNIRRETVNASGVVTGFSSLLFRNPISQGSSGLSGADQLFNANETVHIAMALNQNDPRRAMFGYNDLYEDADPSGTTPTGQIVNIVTPPGKTGTIESILYGGKFGGVNYNQVAYVTTSTGELWVRGQFGPTFTNVTANINAVSGQAGSAIFAVVGDPDDYTHIFVAQGTKILESKDFGATFVDISDNLIGPATADGTAGPGKLTTEIRTLAVFDTSVGAAAPGDLTLIAGGRGGVYRLQTSVENNGGSWTEYGQALPNTVVNDLEMYNNQRIVAGTGGRGIWSIADVSTTIATDSILTITGTAGADVITVSLDPNNSNVILVFDGTATTSWTRGSFSKLQLTGLGGADTFIVDSTIDPITHVPIAGGILDFVNFGISIDGGGDAGDTLRLIADGTTTNKTVTVTNTTVTGNIFTGPAKIDYTGFDLGAIDITTGSGNDTYNVTAPIQGLTTLRGGGGNDTYTVATNPASPAVVTVADTAGTTDTLTVNGTAAADTFGVTATQVTTGTNAVNYSGIETFSVLGLGAGDTFNITGAGGTTNTFDGGLADDTYNVTLDPASTTTYTVADTGASGTDTLNVTGTAGNDTIGVTATQVTLGTNTVAYSGIETVNVSGVSGNDTFNIAGAAGTTYNFDGGLGNDAYNIALNPASTTTYTVADTGASGADTLNVTGTAGNDTFGVTATQVTSGTSSVAYSGIENLNVLGVNGNDTFNITGAGGTTNTFDGGTGGDTYNIALNPPSTTNYVVTDTGATGTDSLNATGTASADAFTISPTQVVLGTQTITYTPAIEALRVSGLGSDDTFALATQGASSNTAVAIDGGTGNDTFSVTGTSAGDIVGVDITSGAGDGTVTGLPQTIAFTSVQKVNFDGAAGTNSLTWRDSTNVAYGTALNPENGVIYTPSGPASGTVRIGNGSAFPTVGFTNVNGNFVANGDPDSSGDRDVFTELGFSTTGQQSVGPFGELTAANGADTFTITDKSIAIINATLGAMRRVDFGLYSSGSPTFSTIHIRGGNETANGDQFTATPSKLTNIVIDGMNPVAGATADRLTFVSNGATVTFPTTDTKFGAPQTRMVQTVDNTGLGFYNIENVNVFDPNLGTPPLLAVSGTASTSEGAIYTLTLGAVNDSGRTVTQYIVNWGDGSSNTYATNGAKTHVYADGPNNFVITVDLVDQFGLHTSIGNPPNKSIAVLNVAPTIAVTAGAPVAEGSISSITLGAVADPGRDTVTSYIVRWGDGFADTYPAGGVRTHRYAANGSYVVRVDLIDEDGTFLASGSTTVTVVSQELFNANKTNLTAAGVGQDVVVYNPDGSTRFAFRPYPGYTGNITVATGDINGDGIDEIVTGTETQATHVKVFDGATGTEIYSFLAYSGFTGGVNVAVGDVLGLGYAQIVTGAGFGGAPHVKVFIANGGVAEAASYFAYDPGYRGGVNVAAGRLDGSGHDLIVTGAGVGGSSHVKAFDVASGGPVEQRSFFAFDPGFSGGVNVAAGQGVIVVSPTIGASSNVVVFRYADLVRLQDFIAFPNYNEGGARVGIGSRSGVSTLLVAPGSLAPPRFKVYRLSNLDVLDDFFIGNVAFNGGIYVG